MDSLQAIELRRLLPPSVKFAEAIPRDFVYRHPSVLKLTEAFEAVHRKRELVQSVDLRQKMVDDFAEQYSLRTGQPDSTPRQAMTKKQGKEIDCVVLLNGSTCGLKATLKEPVRLKRTNISMTATASHWRSRRQANWSFR